MSLFLCTYVIMSRLFVLYVIMYLSNIVSFICTYLMKSFSLYLCINASFLCTHVMNSFSFVLYVIMSLIFVLM